MGQVLDQKIGAETEVKIIFEKGRVKFEVEYQGQQAGAGLSVNLAMRALLEPLKAKIPGTVDDVIIDKICDALDAAE